MSISPIQGDIEYCAHVQNIGWQDFVAGGQVAGTTGQSLRVEAIKIRLTGDVAESMMYIINVMFKTSDGWVGAKNGEPAGTTGISCRVEAIKVQLVAKSGCTWVDR